MQFELFAMLLVAAASLPASAALKVLATTPDWGALTTELGGDKVNVYVATTALQDVHRVEAKPSLVARARSADLVVATGAELEIGWLPVLIQESGNARIQPGAPGYFEASSALRLLEVPSKVDRSMGDIHPLGNPHVQLDPHNIQAVAHALTARLVAARSVAGGVLRGARQGFRRALGRGHQGLGSQGRAAQGRARGHHASRPGLSVPLAGPDGGRIDRAEARRAADRRVSRLAGGQARRPRRPS